MPNTFDVFVSYHWRDQHEVKTLAEKLHELGLTVFLDRWYLTPGRPWPQELERALSISRAVVVCVGPGEMGPWQQREQNFAFDRQAKDNTFPVIPVLLSGANPLLSFLSQNTWIDLRTGIDQPLMLDILRRAIRGEPPGPEVRARLKETLTRISPYKGLAFFREEDAPFFFGRQQAIETLVDAVSKRHFVAVVGSSGSGKSSVVRAGLVPQLRQDIRNPWEIVTLVPNDQPLYNLAAALIPLLEPELDETDRLIQINKQAKAFTSGTLHVRDVIQRILEKQPGTSHLMLIVDQWEELYTLTSTDDGRRRFIDELLAATSTKSLSVVLTLRGDFVGHALAYRPLSDRLQDAQVNLGPMKREELQLAIEKPAHAVGAEFESGLVNRILDDVGEEPGNLPLLAFVLQKLWEDASNDNGRLRHQAYEAMGGVQGALANAAEAAYERLSELEKAAAQRVFLQLVRPAPTGEDTRRRATFAELGEATRALVTTLADQRLLVTDRQAGGQAETVEVAHEALIRHWQRLKDWLNQDREFLLWRERLRTARSEWLRTNNDKEALLRGALLSEAERWLAQRSELTDDERDYITQSVTARKKQERGRRRVLVGTVAVALFAAVAFALLAASEQEQRRIAEKQKALADKRLDDARNVANKIVFTLERDLQTVAGAGAVRRKLLDEANQLVTRLQEGGADDPEGLRMKAITLNRQGDLALSYDNLSQARTLYREAQTIFEHLAQTDPSNSQWQRSLAVSYTKLGIVEEKEGNLDAARAAYSKDLAITERLAQADPSNAGWQKDLLQTYRNLLLLLSSGDCTADQYLTAAEKVLTWFDQTKALEGDAQMPEIREFFREYRAKRGNGSCKNGEKGEMAKRGNGERK